MASPAYYQWDQLGRPLEPARPVRDMVDGLKIAFPRAAAEHLFSWYADERHYQAEPPQDHTPYSATGWPLPCPQWVVFATDVMHRPDLGVDCNVLFPYWLDEAKAGRTPWLKYIIWQAKIYSVKTATKWEPRDATGHFDHIHLSFRTDHRYTSIGTWPITPQEDDMTPEQDQKLTMILSLLDKGLRGFNETSGGIPNAWIVRKVDEIQKGIAGVDPGDCDLTVVSTAVNELTEQVAALRAENTALRTALAAAYTPPGTP